MTRQAFAAAEIPAVLRVDALQALPAVRHGFFTRAAAEGSAAAMLGARDLVTVKQRHTADVVVVHAPFAAGDAPVADAMVTDRPGVALGIHTADCAPVLLADPAAGVIGAAHAGWRGALDGVIASTVAAMAAAGAVPARIVAAVGPCIGQASYEVGEEFRAAFLARDPGFDAFFDRSRAKPHFDLPRFVASRLRAAGIGMVAVHGGDTLADASLFFSFRRGTLHGRPENGRQLSAIVLAA
jgi:YfiH family protein